MEGREFTSIELRLVQRIVLNSLQDLQRAWESVYPLDVELINTEINPQFVSVAPADDVVILITLNVDVEDATGKIQLVIPYSALEPIKDKLQGGFVRNIDDNDNVWHDHIRRHVRHAKVEMSTIFGNTQMNVRQLLALRPGDVLQLDKYADEDIRILVEGHPKYRGVVGVSRGYRAVQLTETT